MMMVWDTIAQQAEFRPDAIAIAALDAQALTYSQFFAHLKMVRQALHDLGIDADRRIALLTQDGVQTAVTMVACCCTAPTIMVGPNTTAIEFDTILRRAGVALVVLGPSLPDHFAKTAMAAGLPILRLTRSPSDAAGVLQPDRQSDYAPGNASETVRRLPTPDDPFTIIMSSGTTGRPKMVPRTHRKIMALASMFGSYLEYGPDDVIIVPTPIHLSDGAYAGSQIWAAGGMAVYNSGEFAVTEFVEQFRRFLPTGFVGSPTLHRAIAREFETSPELLDSSRLRFVRSGTDAMAPELMARLAAQFQCNVFSYYGASETGCLALRWLDHNHLPTTFLGESVFEGLCVLDGRGNPTRPGEIGEIAVPANIFPGYIDDAALNQAHFSLDHFRIGDLGYTDDDGRIYYAGRKADLIIRGGFNISPVEVDTLLSQNSNLLEAACFGVPHPTLGQEVWLTAVPASDQAITLDDIHGFLRDRLAQEKWPRRLIVLESLPRNDMGKILRRDLAMLAAETQQHDDNSVHWSDAREAMLAGLWAYTADRRSVSGSMTLVEAGADSLQAAMLRLLIDEMLGFEIDLASLLSTAGSPHQVASAIAAKAL